MSRTHAPPTRAANLATFLRNNARLLGWLLFVAFLALYVYTAAPSVLSGDSAEFQLAAPLLGVAHPTTYPLYVLLGKLFTLIIPFGDLAWRVTLVSALCAALAVALFFALARRVLGSTSAALIGALALGLAPGLWNAATMAEVYALLAALLVGLVYLIADCRLQIADCRAIVTPSPLHPFTYSALLRRLLLAAFVGGLGFTHHGLFAITGLPLLAGYVLWLFTRRLTTDDRPQVRSRSSFIVHRLSFIGLLALCFAAGMLPWLYPLGQYARYGPFAGEDYGLPRHYFWGAPESWGQVLDLLTGGKIRQGIFHLPTFDSAFAVLRMVGQRLIFEFGPIGVLLGLLGSWALQRPPDTETRRHGDMEIGSTSRSLSPGLRVYWSPARFVWIGAAWMFFATLAYLLLLGPAVQDAPVFTLPMLLPWALWVAAGAEWLLAIVRQRGSDTETQRRGDTETRRHGANETGSASLSLSPGLRVSRFCSVALALLLAATLAWGYTRIHVSSKRQLWLFRNFGEMTLAQLPPGATVITHWEQGMTLQYLILVEGRRPDVWVDVVEPSDDDWGARARRRYADRPVFFIGTPPDVAALPVTLVREDAYADLFELRK